MQALPVEKLIVDSYGGMEDMVVVHFLGKESIKGG